MLRFRNALVALKTIVSSFSFVFMLAITLLLLLVAKLKRSEQRRKVAKEVLMLQPLPPCAKVIRKCCGRGGGRNVTKRQRTAQQSTSEAVSSSPEEFDHSKSNTEMRPCEVGAGSGTNIEVPSTDQPEKIVDITSLSPGATATGATLVHPLYIDYSEPEHESDEDCATRARSSKDKAPIPPSVVEVVIPSPAQAPSGSKVVSAIHHKTLTHVEQDDSSSETESDTRSGGVFVSMKPNTCVFGDSMRKVLQFCSYDHERSLLQEAGDSFGFPIMEDKLGKESAEEILYRAQDFSMKSFLACRAAQRHCCSDLRSHQLSKRTSATTLSYGPPWAHCLGGYQDRLLGGPLGLLDLCHMAPDGVGRKDYGAEVLG
jgi:hypothetical protein